MTELAPREKLAITGAESLSDAELLAIFLRTGSHGIPVMALARQMLNEFGSLYRIMTANETELSVIKGVGTAKITQLHAVAELGRRFFRQSAGARKCDGESTGDKALLAKRAGASGARGFYGAIPG
jgi:DNA replication and repair protein RadC